MALSSAKNRAVLILLAVLLFGAVVGAVVERRYHPVGSLTRRRPPAEGGAHERIARRLQERLSLTDAQRDSVAAVLRRSQEDTHQIRSRIREQMRAIDVQLRADIERVLTDQQVERFRKLRRPGAPRRWAPPPDSPSAP